MDSNSESEFYYEEDDEFCDKFNELTFKNINFDRVVELKKKEALKNESELVTKNDKEVLVSPEKPIRQLGRIDAVFKIGIHPLLMLSDKHRRKFPVKHNHSITPGRYDHSTQVISFLLFDSEIMLSEDKFSTMMEITRPVVFSDNVLTTPTRDFYYWAYESGRTLKPISNIIDIRTVFDCGYTSNEFRVPVITFPKSLGCIAITGTSFPRWAIKLPNGCCSKVSAGKELSRNVVLKTIENLYSYLIEIEIFRNISDVTPPSLLQHPTIAQKQIRITQLMNAIGKTLFTEKSSELVFRMLLIEKGRALFTRLLRINSFPFPFHVVRCIITTYSSFWYEDDKLEHALFDTQLSKEMFRVLSQMDLVALSGLLRLLIHCKTVFIHTYVGLNIPLVIFSKLSRKPQNRITEPDARVIHDCALCLFRALKSHNIPPSIVKQYKLTLSLFHSYSNKTPLHSLYECQLSELNRLILHLVNLP